MSGPEAGRAAEGRSSIGRRLAVLLVAILGGAVLGWFLAGPPTLGRWKPAIQRAARETGVDPALLTALVAVESGGAAGARSGRDARGLLQILPDTAREEARRRGLGPLTDEDLHDPETNLRLGAFYLRRLLDRYAGDEAFALAAYNAGPTPVNRWRRIAPHLAPREVVRREGYEETRQHVERVLAWRAGY